MLRGVLIMLDDDFFIDGLDDGAAAAHLNYGYGCSWGDKFSTCNRIDLAVFDENDSRGAEHSLGDSSPADEQRLFGCVKRSIGFRRQETKFLKPLCFRAIFYDQE